MQLYIGHIILYNICQYHMGHTKKQIFFRESFDIFKQI